MAVTSFIPEVWAAELIGALEERHVFAQEGIVNRDYEGDIARQGDTVHINSLGAPTIATYTKGVTVVAPEQLATTDQTLTIDQAKYFAFEVDDIDKAQTGRGGHILEKAGQLAATGLRDVADTYMGTIASTTAGTILPAQDAATADAAYLLLRKLNLALNKSNTPTDGRWVAVSPEMYALMLGDARFVDASKYGASTGIMNGEVGMALGMRVLLSNNLPAGTAGGVGEVSNFIVAGHPMAITFAEQIVSVEAYRPQDSFSDAVKGLYLFGAKVVRPEALVVCDVDVTVA